MLPLEDHLRSKRKSYIILDTIPTYDLKIVFGVFNPQYSNPQYSIGQHFFGTKDHHSLHDNTNDNGMRLTSIATNTSVFTILPDQLV